MSSPRNLHRRLQSSTRIELARDLHDSLAQDLVAIGFKLDLLVAELPLEFRAETRAIRFAINDAIKKVRHELFALRQGEKFDEDKLQRQADPLKLEVQGNIHALSKSQRRIVDELVRNAAYHSKGHRITVQISDCKIVVADDGHGLHGISELVEELGGALSITSTSQGTKVEIDLP